MNHKVERMGEAGYLLASRPFPDGQRGRKGLAPQLQGCTPFKRKVLKIVSQIPFDQTRSYKWVAKKIGRPMAARAVGQALKKNPLPLLIPCHRVVRSDGKIGGYRWGVALKRELIESERGNFRRSKKR